MATTQTDRDARMTALGDASGKHGRARAAKRSDPAHAPGKRHRKPGPTLRGVKKSDERIPKMRTAETVRQRRKSYA